MNFDIFVILYTGLEKMFYIAVLTFIKCDALDYFFNTFT